MQLVGKKTIAAVALVLAVAGTSTLLFAGNQESEALQQNFFAKEFDLNKDGAITEKEMIQAQENRWKEKNPNAQSNEAAAKKAAERMKERFAKFDQDKNGKISGEEIPGRQTISHEDYVRRASDSFDKMDANKDGKLTAEERDALKKKVSKARAEKQKEKAANKKKEAEAKE